MEILDDVGVSHSGANNYEFHAVYFENVFVLHNKEEFMQV